MKWSVNKIIAVALALACAVPAGAQDKLSLREAVELLLKNSEQVQIA